MGIRIRKAIGYGMVHPDYPALRKRLYEEDKTGEVHDCLFAAYEAARADGVGCERVRLSLETCHPQLSEAEKARYPRNWHEVVIHVGYDFKPGDLHLILSPGFVRQWHRRDNTLDYMEASLLREPTEHTQRVLPGPIYPFMDWMDPESGEQLKDFMPIIDMETWKREHGRTPVPMPPISIRVIADELGFPWKQLRPYFCQWWS